jgi:hypothetical protein
MKPSDVLGLVIRIAGFLLIPFSLWYILAGIASLSSTLVSEQPPPASSLYYFAFGVPAFLYGAVCFFCADWIVKLAYREISR